MHTREDRHIRSTEASSHIHIIGINRGLFDGIDKRGLMNLQQKVFIDLVRAHNGDVLPMHQAEIRRQHHRQLHPNRRKGVTTTEVICRKRVIPDDRRRPRHLMPVLQHN